MSEVNEEENIVDESSIRNDNPYAYLNRSGFTSEKFKIEVKNLPRHYGIKELKKLLNMKLNLKFSKIKIPSQKSCRIFVCFKSTEDKIHALDTINKLKWKGCNLVAYEAKPVPDPLVQKRINFIKNENESIKLDEEGLSEKVRDATTPLWRTPYDNQLEKKNKMIAKVLKQFGNKLVENNPELKNWWINQKKKYNGLPCEMLPIRYSTVTDGYRNKCEFSIGINDLTGQKTIGFRLGSYVQGSVTVAPIDDMPNVPEQMKTAVNIFQKFIQNSKYDVYNPELQQGYWRQFTVRLGFRTNELMIIVGLDPQKMISEDLNVLKNEIRDYFTNGEGSFCKVTSLYLQQIKKKLTEDDEPIYDHVFGQTHISEIVLGKTFRISPQAFFQVNTGGAEILYESVAEVVELTKEMSLIDVCCGTGTIGLCLSEKCGEVLGVEKSVEAVADAKANALLNNVTNATFYAGKAEDILSCVAHKATKEEVIAIVDPPRAGLQHNALIHIRKNDRIKKLVYISCNPERGIKNFVDLGRATSKIYKKEPFLPEKAIPVDLFPHTDHCELIVYFKRYEET